MKKLRRSSLKISLLLAIPVIFTIVLYAWSAFFITLPQIEETLRQGARSMVREQVNSACSLVGGFCQKEQAGLLTRQEAQQQAKEALRSVRYGPGGREYFFIIGLDAVSIMHPFRKHMEGEDMSNIIDSDGERYILKIVALARNHGGGFLEYNWYMPDDLTKRTPKLSCVQLYEPWGWVVGSGILLDDLQQQIALRHRESLILLAWIFAAVSMLSALIIWQNQRIHFQKDRVEDALRQSEENSRITLNSLGEAVIATDVRGFIVRMNPVAEQLTGFSATEAAGQPLQNIFRLKDAETLERIGNMASQPLIPPGEISGARHNAILIDRQGRQRMIASSTAPILNLNRERVGVVLVFRDISRQIALEEQLRQSQKMESIGQLAGGVAHDFNNMLGCILGTTELLAEELQEQPRLMNYVQLIQEAAERTAGLTRKLLAFSRKAPIQHVPVDLHLIIDESIAILERSIDRRIEIRRDLFPGTAMIAGDAAQLENCLLNLALNARDAMPDGGVLSISSRVLEADDEGNSMADQAFPDGRYYEISLADTGAGIPAEIQDRIFEPFFTTKETGKGTGLGLSVVYGTVQDHQGSIRFTSGPDRGTEFKLTFPAASETVLHPTGTEDIVIPPGKTILLVEDEQILRTLAVTFLEQMQIKVLQASNGSEALTVFRSHASTIDLVILDLIMPVMDGRLTFFALKEIRPDVKVIFISGYSRESDLSGLLLDSCAAGFIQKPFRRRMLRQALADVFSAGN